MFGLEYIMALVKMLVQVGFAIVSSIFFKPAWNCVASNYLSEWLPEQFLYIPFWHCVAFILTCTFLGEQINKLVPKIVIISKNT